MTDKLLEPDVEDVYNFARKMRIINHRTGVLEHWQPNYEQYMSWRALNKHDYNFFLKPRQIGLSTAMLFYNLCWMVLNDTNGHEVKLGYYIDTESKAEEQKRRAEKFLSQMSVNYSSNKMNLIFPNGSMIHFATAGGKRAAASLSFQRLHFTELPFWRDATNQYNAIMASLSIEGSVIIETTMGLDDPIAMNLWVGSNKYNKVFFPFEMHEEYRAKDEPGFEMSDEERAWLEGEGFTREDSMRYWLMLLRNTSGNDVHKNFREFPQTPEQSFMFAEGRWCNKDPIVLEPIRKLTMAGVPGEVKIFIEPCDTSHHKVIGLDTAGGKGKDCSAVVLVDGENERICASYVSDDVRTTELAKVAKMMQDMYTFTAVIGNSTVRRKPTILVEVNGVGRGTADVLLELCATIFEFSTTEASSQRFMEITNTKIVEGVAYGPDDLAYEAKQVRTKNGKFLGQKDLFMATGFCYDWLSREKSKPLPKRNDPKRVYMDAIVRRKRRY